MKGLYKFEKHFGRMGSLDGVFIAGVADVAGIVGTKVYFDEALGKHSEVTCVVEEIDICLLSNDPHVVSVLKEKFPDGTVCGWNPLDYVDES